MYEPWRYTLLQFHQSRPINPISDGWRWEMLGSARNWLMNYMLVYIFHLQPKDNKDERHWWKGQQIFLMPWIQSRWLPQQVQEFKSTWLMDIPEKGVNERRLLLWLRKKKAKGTAEGQELPHIPEKSNSCIQQSFKIFLQGQCSQLYVLLSCQGSC